MRVTMNRKFPGQLRMSREVERKALLREAVAVKGRLREATEKRSGRTAGSTRIEGGHLNATKDRRAVRVVQEFGAVPMNWRTNRDYMFRAAKG